MLRMIVSAATDINEYYNEIFDEVKQEIKNI